MINYIPLLTALILTSCQNSVSKNEVHDRKLSNADSLALVKADDIAKDTSGFLENCHSWKGGSEHFLQGVNAARDSLGSFCFYECYDCPESFEIIFVPKTKPNENDTSNVLWNEFVSGCNNQFKNFNCFCFVYPMRDPDKQSDVSAMNIDFPVNVKIYERITKDQWRFLRKAKANTFEELALLQFNTIHKLLK